MFELYYPDCCPLNGKPDYRYALTIKAGARVNSSTNGTTFRTLDDVNFKFDTLSDQRITTIFENDGDTPTKFY